VWKQGFVQDSSKLLVHSIVITNAKITAMAKSSINIAPDYNQYPWRHVNSIHQVFHDSPVLLSLELTTLSLYSLLILHAIRRRKLSVLLAATISGAVNEVVFTSLRL
ncbi:hypothetical protein BOX15_Mlig016769g3, partial [Macrostomum lignano]